MRSKSDPGPVGPQPRRVAVTEIAAVAFPAMLALGWLELVPELVEKAEQMGLPLGRDWADRPTLGERDARVMLETLTGPRPAPPIEPPRRGFVPGPTVPDPSTEKAEVY